MDNEIWYIILPYMTENFNVSVCVEYLPKNSLRHMKGVESIEQFNETKAYVVSPPQDRCFGTLWSVGRVHYRENRPIPL